MTDMTSSLLSGGAEMARRRVSGSRMVCAGFIVTNIGVALGLMATFDVPAYWTTAAVGTAVLLGGTLRYLLARDDDADRRGRPGEPGAAPHDRLLR